MIISGTRWRRALTGLTVCAFVLADSLMAGTASAAPEPPPVAPLSDSLIDLLSSPGGSTGVPTVVMVHGTNMAAADRAVTETGMTKLAEFGKIGVAVARATPQQIEEARSQSGVTYLEGNQPVELFTDTSHEATRGAEAAETLTGADGQPLNGSGISIAVIDSGIDPTHPSFAGGKVVNNLHCDVVVGCIALGNNLPSDVTNGHGTHVSAIAAGNAVTLADGTRVSGAATGAKIVSLGAIAVAAPGDMDMGLVGGDMALNWVLENHAAPCGPDVPSEKCPPIKVTNNSYGLEGGGPFDPMSATTKLQRALVAEAVMSVWSNGNDNRPGDALRGDLDGDDGTANDSNPPGQDPTPGIISVASHFDQNTGVRDDPARPNVSDFSSRGLATDPATWPDISAPGEKILSACRFFFLVNCGPIPGRDGGNYKELDGTSMAAPHISGIIAQLFQLRPDATPAEIEDALKRTAFKYDEAAPVPYTPVGPYTSSFDKGTGLVDVVAAADALIQPRSRPTRNRTTPKPDDPEGS